MSRPPFRARNHCPCTAPDAATTGESVDRGLDCLRRCLGLTPPAGKDVPGHAYVHWRLGQLHERRKGPDLPGYANIACGFFGGICATGTIARTATNIRSHAHGPISGMLHAAFLLLFMLVAAPLMKHIPLAALAEIAAELVDLHGQHEHQTLFNPDRHLDYLDAWIGAPAKEKVAEVAAAYEACEFHTVYQKIAQFTAVELSAIYHDVVKDRLYTDPANSARRRSSQTALHRLVTGLCRMLSPILAFYSVPNLAAAIDLCKRLLHFGGLGHTIALHTQNPAVAREFGLPYVLLPATVVGRGQLHVVDALLLGAEPDLVEVLGEFALVCPKRAAGGTVERLDEVTGTGEEEDTIVNQRGAFLHTGPDIVLPHQAEARGVGARDLIQRREAPAIECAPPHEPIRRIGFGQHL